MMAENISWLVVSHLPMVAKRGASPGRRPPLQLLSEPLEFGLLGPVEVRRGGERLTVGGHRQLAVLTILLTDAARVVSMDRLVDALWGEAPPSGARATLHAYLSKLRRVLEPAGGAGTRATVLATRGTGYLLDVDPETIDAARFERLAAEGRAALAAGDPEQAGERFRRALALWRGPALADFTFEPFAAAEIGRLEELRLSVVEDHIEAALLLGHERLVVADLEPLVAAHPFRDRLRAQLMVALYRSGRQADALRTYQAGRRLLAEELGLEPSPALKALEAAIIRHDADLEGDALWHRTAHRATDTPSGATAGPEAAVFLCSEVEGVAIVGSHSPARSADVVARHRHLVTEAATRHGGRLCQEDEPSRVIAIFSGAGEALAAALELQHALSAETWPRGVAPRVRVGLPADHPAAGGTGPRLPGSGYTRSVGVA